MSGEQKSDYIFRLKANSFTLYTAEDEKFDLTKCLENEWAPRKLLEFQFYYIFNVYAWTRRSSVRTPESPSDAKVKFLKSSEFVTRIADIIGRPWLLIKLISKIDFREYFVIDLPWI